MRRVIGMVVAAGLVVVSPALSQQGAQPAQSPTPRELIEAINLPGTPVDASELPDADTVFENYIEALGGRDAVFSIKTRKFLGNVTLQIQMPDGTKAEQTGRVETYAAAPNIYMQDVVFPGVRTDRTVYDGEHGWRITNFEEVALIEGEELERLRTSAAFYQAANYKEHFVSYEVVGGVIEPEGSKLIRVRVTYEAGREEAFIFEESTGLLKAVIGERSVGEGLRAGMLRMYQNYAEFGGVQYPTMVTEQYANVALLYRLTEVTIGVDMPEIERPAEVTAALSDD